MQKKMFDIQFFWSQTESNTDYEQKGLVVHYRRFENGCKELWQRRNLKHQRGTDYFVIFNAGLHDIKWCLSNLGGHKALARVAEGPRTTDHNASDIDLSCRAP
jgi:hypothetical protein